MKKTDEAFWALLTDLKVSEEYFFLYLHHSKRRVIAITASCLILSFTGLAAWFTENLSPKVSSFIVISAQILGILQPLYPYEKRLYAADCMYKAYKKYADQAEQAFTKYTNGKLSLARLSQDLCTLKRDIANIEGAYCSPELFPTNIDLHKEAQSRAEQYLKTNFL